MKFEQRLNLKLEQRLATVLIQRLDLLQLPELELLQLLKQRLEENLFLEKEGEEKELPLPEEIDDWDTYPKMEYSPTREKNFPIPLSKLELKEFLLSQLRITIIEPKLLEIGEYIIYELDEDGYLPISIEKIAEFFDEDPKIVEILLKQIQRFEPIGVGARNLQECLLVQLESKPKTPKLAISIIKNCFEDFIDQNYEKIRLKFKNSDSNLEQALQCIKLCRPKPGKIWEGDIKYVLPEMLIEWREEEWVASLTDDWIPKIRISKSYQEMLRNVSALSTEEKAYLRKKLQEARFLIEGIEKRRETLTAIANYIIKNELDFLNQKTDSLKFLTLQEVADGIGRNVSTISRAVKGKWIQTPRGAFKLKNFFSGGKIKNYTEIVRRIKELIANEDKSKPLRDQEIAQILGKEGFKIARTTVIKYRTQINILTASKRRIRHE